MREIALRALAPLLREELEIDNPHGENSSCSYSTLSPFCTYT